MCERHLRLPPGPSPHPPRPRKACLRNRLRDYGEGGGRQTTTIFAPVFRDTPRHHLLQCPNPDRLDFEPHRTLFRSNSMVPSNRPGAPPPPPFFRLSADRNPTSTRQ